MRPSPAYREARKVFITEELYRWLGEAEYQKADFFTGVKNDDSEGYPKTFKIGRCTAPESATPDDVFFQLQLYWQSEIGSKRGTVQKELSVEMVPINGKWVVASVGGPRK
jgi:hypothetical protein